MSLNFTLIETKRTRLWDYGWFDLSRFQVGGSSSGQTTSDQVISAFLRAPISQRSFCDQGAWGDPVEHHGPYLHAKLDPEWFRLTTIEDVRKRIAAVFSDPQFTEPPERAQRQEVDAWAEVVGFGGDEVFALDVPDLASVRVEFDFIWLVYNEFAIVNRTRTELSIAVIGYD
ncbi:MAG: hypothetical protein H6839_01815 [Planctomycetes bacterium]|nr:hypothetical protein [Planctomycetota bacterium]